MKKKKKNSLINEPIRFFNWREMTTIKTAYKELLIAYVSLDSPFVEMDAIYQLDELTENYISMLSSNQCFIISSIIDYLDYLKNELTDEYKQSFNLSFNELRYIDLLEKKIQNMFG